MSDWNWDGEYMSYFDKLRVPLDNDLAAVKALKWIYFEEDEGTFGDQKNLLCTEDVLKTPDVRDDFETLIKHASQSNDSSDTYRLSHIYERFPEKKNMLRRVHQPWTNASDNFNLFADWGYQGVGEPGYCEIRSTDPVIFRTLRTAEELENVGIILTHKIFVDGEKIF